MKKLLFTCLTVSLLALPLLAAALPNSEIGYGPGKVLPFYGSGLSLDGFVSARTFDLNHARTGVGLGANFYFLENLGVGVEALTENQADHFVDYAQGNILWRISSGRAALNLLAGAGWDFERQEVYASAGGGPEYALTRNFHIFGDARAVKPIEGGDINALFRAGLRLSF